MVPKATAFCKMTEKNDGHYTVQGHSRFFGTNGKLECDLLLVNYTNLHHIASFPQSILVKYLLSTAGASLQCTTWG